MNKIAKPIILLSLGVFLLLFSWFSYGNSTKSQDGYITVEDGCLKSIGDDCSNPSAYCTADGSCDCTCVQHQYKTISVQEKTFGEIPFLIILSVVSGTVIYFIYDSNRKTS